MKHVNILIVGAGQIGWRHLQGILTCKNFVNLYVFDKSSVSIERCKNKLRDLIADKKISHRVIFCNSLTDAPFCIDLAIVSTSADVRASIVEVLSKKKKIKYWILEKLLAQDRIGLDCIRKSVGCIDSAWVNTPRRIYSWHQQIEVVLNSSKPKYLKVSEGELGLGCNSIHFIDMFSWWTGESLREIDISGLENSWFDSKRMGAKEVRGKLRAKYSGGSIIELVSTKNNDTRIFQLNDGNYMWKIEESTGMAARSDGLRIDGKLPLQSETTGEVVDRLIEKGECKLTSLVDSMAIHEIYLDAFLLHWKQCGNYEATIVPIT